MDRWHCPRYLSGPPCLQGLVEDKVMRNTKRRPVTVGQMLVTEFLEPMNIEINELAEAMGVHRNTLSRIVHDKGALTAPMAIKLAEALGNTPEFWLNIQHSVELWDVRHRAFEREVGNVKRVTPHLDNRKVAH
ncbi:TPA: HigA family addiction module antidote protein [Proteus mirabilis]|nr:HigA family addiction module antidote protein [Salmonella enterica]EIM9052402.1 HigA family addiction module antidote protein [Salmonella enterica subsp. enterica serovar Livingstone]EIT4201950.1 HigA family addiction module antidote protein [Salmonella enterica subsp. enterica serovar Mbandaka]ELB1035139.1 HigA family addiction module antidote protein [Proteus mirabilis]EIM9056154.1 HigA family addiction module antidote protein [Salmonella enterica subsp. enterica serovar Livingstone]